MLIRKAHVYRLYPTSEQAAVLLRWVGAVRCVYNLALEQRRDWWRPGRKFDYASQCREVTALRAEFDWLREVPNHCLQQAVKDVDTAFRHWWAGRAGPPTARRRGPNSAMRFPDASRCQLRRVSRRLGEVKLPKMGWVRLRWDRSIPGTVKTMTVSLRADTWTLAAQYEHDVPEAPPSTLPPIGIDRGIAVFAALSNGALLPSSNHGRRLQTALSRAQRKLARKTRGGKNRLKQSRRVSRLHRKIALSRADFCHKASTAIAKNHGLVVLERLKIQNMVRSARGTRDRPGRNVKVKSSLSRSILDQGWGMFARFLRYKLAERGGEVREVEPRNSSRECSVCGVTDVRSRKSARFTCVGCGHTEHADTNAARVILKRAGGTGLLPAEASGCRAVEAGTGRLPLRQPASRPS